MKSTKITLAEIAAATETTVQSWGLGLDGDRTVVLFADGSVNALMDDGTAVQDIEGGKESLRAPLRRLYADAA